MYVGTLRSKENSLATHITTNVPDTGTVTVIIKARAFDPKIVTIKKGTTVTWINEDTMMHRVVHLPEVRSAELFNSGLISPGQRFSYRFLEEGRYNYADPQWEAAAPRILRLNNVLSGKYRPYGRRIFLRGIKNTGMPDQESQTGGPDPGQEIGESGISRQERLEHFIRMLSDDDENSRWRAAEALGRMMDPGAVEPLIDTLWDDDSRVRLKGCMGPRPDRGRTGDFSPQRLYRMEKEGVQEIITEALEEINLRLSQQ